MENQQHEEKATPAVTGPTHGPQGVDKAPGEEVASDTMQFEQETQKGKKDDGDPELESDQPIEQTSIPDNAGKE